MLPLAISAGLPKSLPYCRSKNMRLGPCGTPLLVWHLRRHDAKVSFTKLLIRTCGTNLRRAHRLRHPVKDHHALPATESRECLGRWLCDADVNVLPVVHGP